MTGWLPDDELKWQGRPVARRVADATARRRAVLTGVVRAIEVHRQLPVRGAQRPGLTGVGALDGALDVWLDARLDDGSGTITLRWLGRDGLGGVVVGATLHVEGTVSGSSEAGRLLILNPLYRFDVASPSAGTPNGPRAVRAVSQVAATELPDGPGPGSNEGSDQAESSTSW